MNSTARKSGLGLDKKFIFGNGYFVFFGTVNQNDFHKNAAYQVVLSADENVIISNSVNGQHVGKNVLIKPLISHKIKCISPILIIYVSPKFEILLNAIAEPNCEKIINLKPEDIPFNANSSLQEISNTLDSSASQSISKLDPRLLEAMDNLSQNLHSATILDVAERCNLSRSRLRTLAREQIGMPLSSWFVWKKLVESNRALSSGASLSEAAFAGGFSDQAHFSRTMKKMFGVTPRNALEIYT